MLLHIAVCDDEAIIAEKMGKIIDNELKTKEFAYKLSVFDTSTKLRDFYKKNIVQLVFLDIDMPDCSGIEIASEINEKKGDTSIVFVTNRDDLVFQSLKCHPYQFIRKIHMEVEIPQVISDFLEFYKNNQKSIEIGKRLITIQKIIYLESQKHNIECIYYENNSFIFRGVLKEYEKFLEPEGFCRIHIGYLVNFKYVAAIKSGMVILDNGKSLPLSKDRQNYVKQKYLQYVRNKRI